MNGLRTSTAWVLLASACAAIVIALGAPAVTAQVAVAPATVQATLPSGQQAEIMLEVTNEGTEPLALFAVPLPEGGAPDDVGELLFHTEPATVDDARGLTMMPDGRLFAATYGGGGETIEYTTDLAFVREFEHPHTGFSTNTTGIAWMPPEHAPPGHPEGILWWLDLDTDCEQGECTVVSTLLIEGDLDGNETGRTVELTLGPGVPDIPSFDRGIPLGVAYDSEVVGPSGALGLFYYTDANNESFYAVDVEGTVAEGYPVPLTDYDPGGQRSLLLNSTVDATQGSDGGRYFEVGFVLPGEDDFERVVVTDRWGRNTGVETPLGDLTAPDDEGDVIGVRGVLRSRIAPSVMYLYVVAETEEGFGWLYAIRAAPLPPRWLRASAAAPASLEVAPDETDTLTVKLNTEGLAVGTYAGLLDLRADDPNGESVATVPVTLTVTEATAGEEEPETEAFALGAAYPNPARGAAILPLTLGEASEVRVVVYDVLGREVATLADGRLAAGSHRLALDGSGLPAGVYVVRATGGGSTETRRVTVMR